MPQEILNIHNDIYKYLLMFANTSGGLQIYCSINISTLVFINTTRDFYKCFVAYWQGKGAVDRVC